MLARPLAGARKEHRPGRGFPEMRLWFKLPTQVPTHWRTFGVQNELYCRNTSSIIRELRSWLLSGPGGRHSALERPRAAIALSVAKCSTSAMGEL
jgi:hypothetical protein